MLESMKGKRKARREVRSWTCPACGNEGLRGRSCPKCKAELVRVSRGDDGLLLRLSGTASAIPVPPQGADPARAEAFDLRLRHGAVVRVELTEQTELLCSPVVDAADITRDGAPVEVLGQVASVFEDAFDGPRAAPELLQLMRPRLVAGGPGGERLMHAAIQELRGKEQPGEPTSPLGAGPRGVHVETYEVRPGLNQLKITCREVPTDGAAEAGLLKLLAPLALLVGGIWMVSRWGDALRWFYLVPLLLVAGLMAYALLTSFYNYTEIRVDQERLSFRRTPLPTLSGWSRPAPAVKRLVFNVHRELVVELESGKTLPLLWGANDEQKVFVRETVETALGIGGKKPAG
jgi:hypothetical protein